MDRLISFIEKTYENKIVDAQLTSDEQEELDYLEDFLKDFDIRDINSILNFDRKKFFIASIASETEDRNFGILKSDLEKVNDELLSYNDYLEIADVNNTIVKFIIEKSYYLLESLPFLDDYDDESLDIISELKRKDLLDDAKKIHRTLKKLIKTEEQRITLFEMFKKYNSKYIFVLSTIATLNDVIKQFGFVRKDEKKHEGNNILDVRKNIPLYVSDIPSIEEAITFDRGTRKSFRNLLEACSVNRFYNSINERVSYLKKLPDKRNRENNNIRKRKEKIVSQLKAFDQDKIIEPTRTFIESIQDERIKYFILRNIMIHNMRFHLDTCYEIEKEKEKSELELLFKKSSFSFDNLTEEEKNHLLEYGNMGNIQKILITLTESSLHFNREFPIYDILLLSKPQIVSSILKLLSAGFISEQFILTTPEIFVREIDEKLIDISGVKEAKYSTLIKNISILGENNIQAANVSKKDKEIILMDENKLKKSLGIVNLYGLDYSKSNNYELLKNNRLVEVIDNYIELGLGDYVRSHPYLISEKSYNRIKRIRLCKLLNIPILIDDRLNPKITGNEFTTGKNVISDSDIDGYIFNSVNRYLNEDCFKALKENDDISVITEEIEELKNYIQNDYEYNFNGIVISKNKVTRNYMCLKEKCQHLDKNMLLFNSIIYGSTLDDEEIDLIANSISENNDLLLKK